MKLQSTETVLGRVKAMRKGSKMSALSALAAHAPGGLGVKMKKPLAADATHFVHGKK